ncbi:MAG: hypothetical protein JNJ71_09695 [Rubrivivax sp.]|nr:hypothetical protein [Rubrivivax sp.]
MSISLPSDSLDPVARKFGEVAGLLSSAAGDQIIVNDGFVRDPAAEFAKALSQRQDELIELLGLLLGQTDGEVLGLPAAGEDDRWIPIRGPDGDTGLYLVMRSASGRLYVGVGWRWAIEIDDLNIALWAHVPLISTTGTGPGTRVEIASPTAPMRLAAEVTLDGGFGASGLQFRGVRGSIAIQGFSEPPAVALVLLGLRLPGDASARDRSLADLLNLPAAAWIETAAALFTAQLQALGSPQATAIVGHLLPLLGITAPAGGPRLRWETLPERGTAVFDDWFLALVADGAALRGWLGHWQGLLLAGAGGPLPLAVEGAGTRADPWRVGVRTGGIAVLATAATETAADGVRRLLLGLRAGSADIPLAGPLRLVCGGSAEIVSIPIGGPGAVRALPSLSVGLTLKAAAGDLVDHSFAAGDPLAALARLRVRSLEAGFGLNAAGQPVPQLRLLGVDCARGSWPVLDLSSADAVMDGLGAVASNLIQQQLEQGLGLLDGGTHAGRRVAALLGLVAPQAGGAPAIWPLTLPTHASRIADFLGDPLGAIGRYHAQCLTTPVGGAPAWRFLLAELGALLQSTGSPLPAVRGAGTAAAPWRLALASTPAGQLLLQAQAGSVGARPQLGLSLALEPRPLVVDAVQLSLAARLQLLALDLGDPATRDAARGSWLASADLDLRLHGDLRTPRLGELELSAEALSAGLRWQASGGAGWRIALTQPRAAWAGRASRALPDLLLDASGISSWNLAAPDLGGALGAGMANARDAVSELVQYLTGHLMLEHGGPAGFAAAALLGLLPADPGIELPRVPGGGEALRLPADFPRLQPASWGSFFADPRPALQAQLRAVLSNPRHALPLLRWLGLALQGLFPRRSRAGERLRFDEALGDRGRFPVDGAGLAPQADDAAPEPLSLPSLESFPFTLEGAGRYEQPYALSLRAPAARAVRGLVWLDPEGPPSGDALAVALSVLGPALRDTGALAGRSAAELAQVLQVLSGLDEGLAGALQGGLPASLGSALQALEDFLRTSDGLLLTASQLPGSGSGWSAPAAALEAAHTGALAQPAVIAEIRSRLLLWDAAGTAPALLLAAPFGGQGDATALATALGGSVAPFSFRSAGVAPEAVSTATLAGTPRIVNAELAVFNPAPGLAPTARLVPLDGAAGSATQAEQVARLIQRLAALHPGRRVLVVAHSASGLAARAAVQRAGIAPLVRGLLTVGTPHLGTPAPWLANPPLAEGLGLLQRLAANLPLPPLLAGALESLWGFVRERTPGGAASPWPQHAFAPAGAATLPAGTEGHAVALRLPGQTLAQALGTALATRATQLRTALAARAPVSHIGFGLELPPQARSGEGALKLRTSLRLDLARLRVAPGTAARALPRLQLEARLQRDEGWLVGSASARVRVRSARMAAQITSAGIVPVVQLLDVSVEGVQAPLATLRRAIDTDSWLPDDLLVPALDALLAQLSAGSSASADVLALCRLLAGLDILQRRDPAAATDVDGYALHPDGWASLLADAPAYLQRILANVAADATRRADLIGRLRTLFGLAADDLSRLLLQTDSDDAAWRALRQLLRALELLQAPERGSLPQIARWLELLQDPAAWLLARVRPLLADATRRGALLAALRDELGVRDIGSPVVELPLGAGLSLRVESTGRVALNADGSACRLGPALSLAGAARLDLAAGSASLDLRLQPQGIATGLRLSLALPAGGGAPSWQLALDFSDGARHAPYDALPLLPVPADLPTRLGALLPRLTVTTLATALLDSVLLPRVPAIAPALQALGLATAATATERARIRNLARVVADPLGWLQSSDTLFRPRAAGAGLELDPTRVVSLLRALFGSLGLVDGDGQVALPMGLRLRLLAAPAASLQVATSSPLALAGGVSLGGSFQLGWTPAGSLGAGGALELGAALPAGSPWSRLVVQTGVSDGQFRLALGPEGSPFTLLPFAGFDAQALGAQALRLLPTLLDALLRALSDSGDAAVASFITQLRAAAATLQLDTVARLDALVQDPLAWLRQRFSAAQAPASVTAIRGLIPDAATHGFAAGGAALRFAPAGSPIALELGRPGAGIGLGIDLTGIDLGPVTLTGELSIGVNDSGAPAVVLACEVDVSVDEGVIAPAGVSIRPSAALRIGSSGPAFWLYPIGDEPGSPDFRLDILPSFQFAVEGGSLEDGLLALARRVLVPVAVEAVLDTPEVTGWLNTPLVDGQVRPGPILQAAGLVVADGAPGPQGQRWNLGSLDSFTDPLRLSQALIGATLNALTAAFEDDPVVDFGVPGSGLFMAADKAAGSFPRSFGVRVAMPELRLGDDPEILVRLGGETDWIAQASNAGAAVAKPGFSLLLLRDSGSGSNRFSIAPLFELAGVGLKVSGRGDEPLFDIGGFQLGGVESLLYLKLDLNLSSTPQLTFGVYGDLEHIAIPLGSSDSNPVAQSLMSGGGGDAAPVNPRFSVRAAYVDKFWLELGDTPGRNEVWFPIQRTFGPVSVQQVGIRWIGGPQLQGAILLDGGVSLAGLSVGVDDLSLTIPFAQIGDLSQWQLGLRGLAVAYDGGGVRIGGGLLQASDEIRYDGFLLVEVGGKSFVALGSYGVVGNDPSMFVFVIIGIPIGGPPYFFITGLAGGFGYNRGLVVPPIEGLPQFPLIQAMGDASAVTEQPMQFLQRMGPMAPMERGSYWFAAGLTFTSFSLLNSQALLYVLLNRGLEIGLLGMSRFELPPAVPLVSVELALKARFSTIEGVVSVEARLTDNSWVLSRDCRLTGGFAFYLWFGGEHAGDFVITIGGYHPRYTPPAHYPVVPRLGFNWRVSSQISIKGEAYFALTPREVMAGGLLEAVYDSGDVRAWFRAWANMYIQWRPFWFEVEIGISIGVAVDTFLGTAKVECGASLIVWGPEIGGEVTVDVWIISITIPFGADRVIPQQKQSWDQFRTQLLPPEDSKLFAGGIERGLISGSPATGPWVVLPEFVIRTETLIGASDVRLGLGTVATAGRQAQPFDIDVRPMQEAGVQSLHVLAVFDRLGNDVTSRFQVRELLSGNVPRALWDTDNAAPERSVIPAYTGARLVAEIDRRPATLDSTGAIPWARLFDFGDEHPLPFARELDLRVTVGVLAQQSKLLDVYAQLGSGPAWQAQFQVLGGAAWQQRREATLGALKAEGVRIEPSGRRGDVTPRGAFRRGRRSAPALIRSLHEGLAAEAVLTVETETVAPPDPPQRPRVRIRPRLQAVLRLRPEPTSGSAGAIRTTVSQRAEARVLDATQMQSLIVAPVAGAALLRSKAAPQPRATSLASSGQHIVREAAQTSLRERAALDQIGLAALGGGQRFGRSASVLEDATLIGQPLGTPVDPGATLRFELPSRDVEGSPPSALISGPGAARVTVLDRAGAPLADVELSGAATVALPTGAATVAVTGLGLSRQDMTGPPALGAVTLTQATQAVPAVGWQAHSQLIALSDTTLMARGALLRLGAASAALARRGTVRAHEAVEGQTGLETWLPVQTGTVVIVLDDGPDETPGDLTRSVQLGSQHAVLSEAPVVITAGSRVMLVHEVLKADPQAPWMLISLALTSAWIPVGVIGLQGPAADWVSILSSSDLDTLVEDGPLTATGSARLLFAED